MNKILQSLTGENDEIKNRFKEVCQRLDNLEANIVDMESPPETKGKLTYADN